MKFGLILFKRSPNLGDDIQSYAALKFLPHVDYYIDREDMASFIPEREEPVAVIFNGWFLYNHTNWPPSDFIFPLLTSIHFGLKRLLHGRNVEENFVLDYAGADFLRKNGPVGCRDYPMIELMRRHAIPAEFSGCLTLTLEPYPDIAQTDEILLVDACRDGRSDEMRHEIQRASGLPVRLLTHKVTPDAISAIPYEDRLHLVEERLKLYQSARCVVTTRLHCALPCLALGTPALLMELESEKSRMDTYYPFFPLATVDAVLRGDQTAFFKQPSFSGHEGWRAIRKNLHSQCLGFIKRMTESPPGLPGYAELARRGILRREALERIIAECSR